MATRKTKMGDAEKLDDTNMVRVIQMLEAEKPCSKKDACAALNIAYNTARLTTLIEKFKEKKTKEAERRAANRGKPASRDDVVYIVKEYLEGAPVSSIADRLFRSPGFINNVLEEYSVPRRASSHNYFRPELIPEATMRSRFKVGEVVYSARYDSIARIEKESTQNDTWVYRVWLLSERWQQYAYTPAEELASLEHLEALGANFN
jgi:hypothetical protein